MNNTTLYIANRKKIFERFFQLIILITVVLTAYYFVRYYLNSNYQFSYASIVGYVAFLIWITVTEVSVRKLEFKNEKEELIITKKSFFGKEKRDVVKYSKLEYEVKTLNQFWGYLVGKKRLTLMNGSVELAKISSTEEFNTEVIQNIEKTLMEIKTLFGKSDFKK